MYKIAAYIDDANTIEKKIFVNLLKEIAQRNASIEILYFSKTIIDNLSKNERQIKIPINFFLKIFWKRYGLTKILQSEKATILLSENICLDSKIFIPQYLFVSNIEKFKNRTNKIVEHFFVVEDFYKSDLIQRYKIAAEKITTSYYGYTKTKNVFSSSQLEAVKALQTNGFDYFLFVANTSSKPHLIMALKAFSLFKKWQKSSMKLVVCLENNLESNLIPDFKNYKHKDEVIFVNEIKNDLIAASYAVIDFSKYSVNSYLFTALEHNVPLILSNNITNQSVFSDAALYIETAENILSENMQLLYKNEMRRNEIIQAGKLILAKYDDAKASNIILEKLFYNKN